jgi:hypothetical protein
LKKDKSIEISVKTVFIGRKSAEQAFIDLIKRRIAMMSSNGLESSMKTDYNNSNVVFPDVHAPERGIC